MYKIEFYNGGELLFRGDDIVNFSISKAPKLKEFLFIYDFGSKSRFEMGVERIPLNSNVTITFFEENNK